MMIKRVKFLYGLDNKLVDMKRDLERWLDYVDKSIQFGYVYIGEAIDFPPENLPEGFCVSCNDLTTDCVWRLNGEELEEVFLCEDCQENVVEEVVYEHDLLIDIGGDSE